MPFEPFKLERMVVKLCSSTSYSGFTYLSFSAIYQPAKHDDYETENYYVLFDYYNKGMTDEYNENFYNTSYYNS